VDIRVENISGAKPKVTVSNLGETDIELHLGSPKDSAISQKIQAKESIILL
jgi:hypothetical protein